MRTTVRGVKFMNYNIDTGDFNMTDGFKPPEERSKIPDEIKHTIGQYSDNPEELELTLTMWAVSQDWRYTPDTEVEMYEEFVEESDLEEEHPELGDAILETAEQTFGERDAGVVYIEDTPVDMRQVKDEVLSDLGYDAQSDLDFEFYEGEGAETDYSRLIKSDMPLEEGVASVRRLAEKYARKQGYDTNKVAERFTEELLETWKNSALNDDTDTGKQQGKFLS